jgi:hypothetical protein
LEETQIGSDTSGYEREWRDFFKIHCNALFQTALLLTADAVAAEVALTRSIEELDIACSPGQTSLASWKKAVVMRSIETLQLSASPPDPITRFMLQPGVQRVIEIERSPRICFVLRILLGHTTAFCAQMLGVEERGVLALLQMAMIQLQEKSVRRQLLLPVSSPN